MITFLASLFIKDSKNYKEPSVRQAYGVLSGAVGIGLNILLFFGKWLAGTISGSIAIIADAFNNLSDAGSSIITLIGFRLSGQEPDPEHPFGHGRMEYVSGLVVAAVIFNYGSGTDTGFHQKDSSSGSNRMLCINYRDSADIDCCKAVYDLLQQESRKED